MSNFIPDLKMSLSAEAVAAHWDVASPFWGARLSRFAHLAQARVTELNSGSPEIGHWTQGLGPSGNAT